MVNCTERNSFSKKMKLPNIELDFSQNNNNNETEGNDDNKNNINYNTCSGENNIFKNIKKIPVIKKTTSNRNNNSNNKNNMFSSSNKIKTTKSNGIPKRHWGIIPISSSQSATRKRNFLSFGGIALMSWFPKKEFH